MIRIRLLSSKAVGELLVLEVRMREVEVEVEGSRR